MSAPRSRRIGLTTAIAAVAIGATSLTGAADAAVPTAPTAHPGNVVVEWSHTLLSLVQTPGAQPATVQPTRDFAIMSAAVSDAVTATDPDHSHDPLHASVRH